MNMNICYNSWHVFSDWGWYILSSISADSLRDVNIWATLSHNLWSLCLPNSSFTSHGRLKCKLCVHITVLNPIMFWCMINITSPSYQQRNTSGGIIVPTTPLCNDILHQIMFVIWFIFFYLKSDDTKYRDWFEFKVMTSHHTLNFSYLQW